MFCHVTQIYQRKRCTLQELQTYRKPRFFKDSSCILRIRVSKSSEVRLCRRLSTFIGKLSGVNELLTFKIIF